MQNIDNYKKELYYHSIKNEKKQTNYLKNQQQLKNAKSGEIITLNYNFDSKQKQYIKTIEQKVNALVSIATSENLKPIFLTLTLPSCYHPFLTLKNNKKVKNKNYKFDTLENAIGNGYQKLKEIYRIFYKRVKNNTKEIYYIKVAEPHKSLITHMHIMLFIPADKLQITKKLFFKVCLEFELKRVDFDESITNDNIKNATAYIMKYILKTLNSKDDFFRRYIDGWRKKHKIRACEMSNLSLNIEVYKKLYYNLPADLKQNIEKEIKENNLSFFEYFVNNTTVHQIIYKEDKMSD